MWESFGCWLGLSHSDMMGGPLSHTPDDNENESPNGKAEVTVNFSVVPLELLVFVWFISLMKVPQDHFLVEYMPGSLFSPK